MRWVGLGKYRNSPWTSVSPCLRGKILFERLRFTCKSDRCL
jgi:hypothetical protein